MQRTVAGRRQGALCEIVHSAERIEEAGQPPYRLSSADFLRVLLNLCHARQQHLTRAEWQRQRIDGEIALGEIITDGSATQQGKIELWRFRSLSSKQADAHGVAVQRRNPDGRLAQRVQRLSQR